MTKRSPVSPSPRPREHRSGRSLCVSQVALRLMPEVAALGSFDLEHRDLRLPQEGSEPRAP